MTGPQLLLAVVIAEGGVSRRNHKNSTTMKVSISATTSRKSIRTSMISLVIVGEVGVAAAAKTVVVAVDEVGVEGAVVLQLRLRKLKVKKSLRMLGARIQLNAAVKLQIMESFWTLTRRMRKN